MLQFMYLTKYLLTQTKLLIIIKSDVSSARGSHVTEEAVMTLPVISGKRKENNNEWVLALAF